jgi:hypothetical protein
VKYSSPRCSSSLDIEIIFLYPWAVAFDNMAVFGLVEMILFILLSSSPTPTCGVGGRWD